MMSISMQGTSADQLSCCCPSVAGRFHRDRTLEKVHAFRGGRQQKGESCAIPDAFVSGYPEVLNLEPCWFARGVGPRGLSPIPGKQRGRTGSGS